MALWEALKVGFCEGRFEWEGCREAEEERIRRRMERESRVCMKLEFED